MFRRLLVAACPALLALAMVAPPAQAKGAESVTISGPGVDHVTLTYTKRAGDIDLDAIATATRIYEIWTPRAQRTHEVRAPDVLGPAYTVDYDFFEDHVVQRVFPFASPGPVIYFPPGQELYGTRISSRWLVATPQLRRALVRLGAHSDQERPAVEATSESSPATTDSVLASVAEGVTDWWPIGLGVTVAGATLGWLVWRRQHSHAKQRLSVEPH